MSLIGLELCLATSLYSPQVSQSHQGINFSQSLQPLLSVFITSLSLWCVCLMSKDILLGRQAFWTIMHMCLCWHTLKHMHWPMKQPWYLNSMNLKELNKAAQFRLNLHTDSRSGKKKKPQQGNSIREGGPPLLEC